MEITTLPKGTKLFTGQTSLPSQTVFASPFRSYAETYVKSKAGGKLYVLRVKEDLKLVRKVAARKWIKDKNPIEEWEGFGSSGPDYSVARSLCRKAKDKNHRLNGIDGWQHMLRSQYLGEVMLCNLDKVQSALVKN